MTHLNTSIVIKQGGKNYISTGFPTWFLLDALVSIKNVNKRLNLVWDVLIKQKDFIEWNGELKDDKGYEYGNIHNFPKEFRSVI